MAGPQVAEVQCLLRRAGYSPGDVDGIYGDLTQRAVTRLQATHPPLVTDGVVGAADLEGTARMTTTRSRRPEDTRLVEGLRELKDRSGLSLAGLSAKTTYSKSSWERYLNGKALPPRRAVEELCGLTGEPGARLLALLDLALQVPAPVRPRQPVRPGRPSSRRPPGPAPTEADPLPEAPAPGRRRLLPVGIALGVRDRHRGGVRVLAGVLASRRAARAVPGHVV